MLLVNYEISFVASANYVGELALAIFRVIPHLDVLHVIICP